MRKSCHPALDAGSPEKYQEIAGDPESSSGRNDKKNIKQ
jgi:hypothetical protein